MLGLINNSVGQQGGNIYLRHGIKEAFHQLKSALPLLQIGLYTNLSKELFEDVVWPKVSTHFD